MARPRKRGAKPQSTRLYRAQCGNCAYTVRVTRKWLADAGPPLCPCNREPMECPDWETDAAAYPGPCNEPDLERISATWGEVAELAEGRRDAELAAAEAAHRGGAEVVRDQSVTARAEHDCGACGAPIHKGEVHRAITLRDETGALVTERECAACMNGAREGHHRESTGEGFYFSPDGVRL